MNEIVDCNLAKYIFDRTAKKNQQNKIKMHAETMTIGRMISSRTDSPPVEVSYPF
jgi:hypothetical protein